MKIRKTITLVAIAATVAWTALGVPSVQAQDKAPDAAPAAAPPAPDAAPAAPPAAAAAPAPAEAPKEAATPAAAPAAAPAKTDTTDSTGTTENTDKINGSNAGTAGDLQWPVPPGSPSINPDGEGKVTNDELIANVAHNKIAINLVWTLVTGFLVVFMQAGFALVETGLCHAKNAARVMATNFMIQAPRQTHDPHDYSSPHCFHCRSAVRDLSVAALTLNATLTVYVTL